MLGCMQKLKLGWTDDDTAHMSQEQGTVSGAAAARLNGEGAMKAEAAGAAAGCAQQQGAGCGSGCCGSGCCGSSGDPPPGAAGGAELTHPSPPSHLTHVHPSPPPHLTHDQLKEGEVKGEGVRAGPLGMEVEGVAAGADTGMGVEAVGVLGGTEEMGTKAKLEPGGAEVLGVKEKQEVEGADPGPNPAGVLCGSEEMGTEVKQEPRGTEVSGKEAKQEAEVADAELEVWATPGKAVSLLLQQGLLQVRCPKQCCLLWNTDQHEFMLT